MDTINKLLKKQAPKRRGKVSAAETAEDVTPQQVQESQDVDEPEPTMLRYVFNRSGCRVGVPEKWLGSPAGSVFGPAGQTGPSKLIEEV